MSNVEDYNSAYALGRLLMPENLAALRRAGLCKPDLLVTSPPLIGYDNGRAVTVGLTNSSDRYGALTKLFHWLIVILFAWQYASGNIMTEMQRGDVVAGLGQNTYFNWHKSIGLVALFIAILRIINRSVGNLPNWAPTLGSREKIFIHRAEQVLYLAMFVMPISGYIYVMAGNFGVLLFGEWRLPNPIGKNDTLAFYAKWVHIIAGYVLAATVLGHVLLVLRHQLFMRDGLLWRMLPARNK